MDAKKFGAFVAALRKEQKLTQAELGARLHVTDKAVSKWERGIGLPDIHTLEPMAEALGVTVLELIRSERMDPDSLNEASAATAVADVLELAREQKKKERKLLLKTVLVFLIIAAVISGILTQFVSSFYRLLEFVHLFLSIAGIFSGISLLFYSLVQKLQGLPCRKPLVAGLVILLISVLMLTAMFRFA